MKKRLNPDVIKPGDIILTTTAEFPSGAIRTFTKSDISHAMICVGYSSVIHAVTQGVRSENTQRIFFKDDLPVYVMRLNKALSDDEIKAVCNYVRSKIGSQYTYVEAARAWRKRGKRFSSRQFCSRLVAQAYAEAGYKLVQAPDFCTPGQLKSSELLVEINNALINVPQEEVEFWEAYTSGTDLMHEISLNVLNGVRKLDKKVQDFNDVLRLVIEKPNLDDQIAELYLNSGYLDFWKRDIEINPAHYDLAMLENIPQKSLVREYCLSAISDNDRLDNRYMQTLSVLVSTQKLYYRRTISLLIVLYENLLQYHVKRFDVAEEWIKRNSVHP